MESVVSRIPNPVRLRRTLELREVDLHRRIGCVRYRRCLDHAIANAWISFTCVRCFGFRPRCDENFDWDAALEFLARGLANRLFPTVDDYVRSRRAPERS